MCERRCKEPSNTIEVVAGIWLMRIRSGAGTRGVGVMAGGGVGGWFPVAQVTERRHLRRHLQRMHVP